MTIIISNDVKKLISTIHFCHFNHRNSFKIYSSSHKKLLMTNNERYPPFNLPYPSQNSYPTISERKWGLPEPHSCCPW